MSLLGIDLPTIELPSEDGEPLETSWHRAEINLLIESIRQRWQGRTDYFVGGNMFVYYSLEQALNRDYRGPDFFVVLDVDGSYMRPSWIVWKEGGRYPNIIVELLSSSTAEEDRTTKKELYERVFRTPDYFLYNPENDLLEGWHLGNGDYVPLAPNAEGRLWSGQLKLWLGKWEGEYLGEQAVWLRFFDEEGNLVPTIGEAERARADQERARANQVAGELESLQARLRAAGIDPDTLPAG